MYSHYNAYFPEQRVSGRRKQDADWYANCIDYIIHQGLACNDRSDTELKLNILHDNIPTEFYKKTLNPYNSTNEKYQRFPATMRNFDIMNDVIRRYVSEYFKGVHEFIVGANNPEIALRKNLRLQEEILKLAQDAFMKELEANMQQAQAEAQQQGQATPNVDPTQLMPDPEEFVHNFEQNYVDEESAQGQDVLDYVRAMTNDTIIYLSAFFNYCALGECFTYCDVRDNNIIKENVPVIEAYPIPNANYMVEDHDMFARKMLMSYNQIIDSFDEYLDEKDRKFLETYYAHYNHSGATQMLNYSQMFENYADVCSKFGKEERELFKKHGARIDAVNNNLFEVWHVVWKGEARRGILTYVNEVGLQTTRIVEEDYKMNPEAGDINIEWEYETQVYEGYRIGNRYNSIYPVKARPILFNRNGKLPYNGIMEVIPTMGKFSIIQLLTPFQVARNIFIYHREMVIAKNKMFILLMPESLVADDTEDRIYKMAADGVLYYDDSEDTNSTKAQQIRMINADMGQYIQQMTQLIEAIKIEARETVDMNAQRYGEIAQSAGAATTQQAVAQSSMGSVIIMQMFDEFRKADYNRDLDYGKYAFVEGLSTAYWNGNGEHKYLSLDVNSYLSSDYSVGVRNDAKEIDKLQQLRQWAFSAAQNGDLEMAMAAIKGDNVTQITKAIDAFTQIKRQHEEQMQQQEQMIQQQAQELKLQEIAAKGEQDRETLALKYQYEMQLKYMDVDMSLLANAPEDTSAKDRLAERAEQNKANIENQKLNLDREKMQVDLYNAAADRQVKLKEMETQLKIAKTNKNKYDK